MITRRLLLQALAAAPLALGKTTKPRRVLVLGAGMAGLSAAYQLRAAGHKVTVLEGQMRPGGRVETIRTPFSPGVWAEAGAVRIPDHHQYTHQYIKLLNLPLEPYLAEGQPLYFYNGKPNRTVNVESLWEFYVKPVFDGLQSFDERKLPPQVLAADKGNFEQFLRSRKANEDAIKLLTLGMESPEQSATWWLAEDADLIFAKSYSRISGGNDKLPKALAAKLGPLVVKYGHKVLALAQSETGVKVTTSKGPFEADYLICTLPFPLLKTLDLGNAISARKKDVIDNYGYTPVTRVFAETKSRFWERDGLNGQAYTDLPVMRIWPGSTKLPDGRGLLHTYTMGEQARAMQEQPDAERIESAVQQMVQVFPDLDRELVPKRTATKCWGTDPWALGAYAAPKPGQFTKYWPQVAEPDGRIHFAGEHTSLWIGWMQGAIQSGHRAAREIAERAV